MSQPSSTTGKVTLLGDRDTGQNSVFSLSFPRRMTLFRIKKIAQVSSKDLEIHFRRHCGPRWVLWQGLDVQVDVIAELLGGIF